MGRVAAFRSSSTGAKLSGLTWGLASMQDFRSSQGNVRFGAFELDEDAGELRREGIKVRLQEQPLQILQILLQHPGKVITREELRQSVWPSDNYVQYVDGLNNALKKLRETRGDT